MKDDLLEATGGLILGTLLLALVAAIIIGLPLLVIWSFNTLGVANASYSLFEWFAAFLLLLLFGGGKSS